MPYQEAAGSDFTSQTLGFADSLKLQRRITSNAAGHAQQGDLERAMETLELGLRQYPDNHYFLGQLGQLYRRAGYMEDARDCLERSLAQKPGDIRTLTALAGVCAELGHNAEAEKALGRARALDPNDQFVIVSLARLMSEEGRYREAADLLRDSGGLEAGNKFVIASYGIVEAMLGHRELARDVLENGHTMHPRDPYIINLLGILRGEMGDHAAAEDILIGGMHADKRNRFIATSLATVFARQKKFHEAERALLTGLKYNQTDTVLLNSLGNVYAQIGDCDRAEEVLVEARRLDARNIVVLTTLGHTYLKAGKYAAYNVLIKNAGTIGNRDASYLYLTAKGALLQGHRAEAAAAAKKLFDLRGIDAQGAILYLACSDSAAEGFTATFGEAGVADLKARAAEIVANPALIDLYDPKLRSSDMLHCIGKSQAERAAARTAERRVVRAASVFIASLVVGATGFHFSGVPVHTLTSAAFTGAPMNVWVTLTMALCCCMPDVPQARRIYSVLKKSRR